MSFYKTIFRPLLFRIDSERAHDALILILKKLWSFRFGRTLTSKIFVSVERPRFELLGLKFTNPIGLAAGFDKNAVIAHGLENFGFGFVEIGTVTPRAQEGNVKPRVFREPACDALLNRMGFPNEGMDAIFENYVNAKRIATIPIGVNIGKNKDTPNAHAISDYETLFTKFSEVADYFTVNISSPNTPGLRALQSLEFFDQLDLCVKRTGVRKPVFIKLSPEITEVELKTFCERINHTNLIQGLVLSNTLMTDLGGLSGKPVAARALAALQVAKQFLAKEKIVISVGGISTAGDVRTRLAYGANLVQLYTSMVYEGPSVVKNILRNL